ncbi:MAG: hypothetical protein LBL59_07325 [Xanthomonadaceae bacterium]|nr:hypothetical protein [Xanthomonadaceae bacterium]
MGKRFGRNQKRKLREALELAETKLRQERRMAASEIKNLRGIVDYVKSVFQFSPYSAFLPPDVYAQPPCGWNTPRINLPREFAVPFTSMILTIMWTPWRDVCI